MTDTSPQTSGPAPAVAPSVGKSDANKEPDTSNNTIANDDMKEKPENETETVKPTATEGNMETVSCSDGTAACDDQFHLAVLKKFIDDSFTSPFALGKEKEKPRLKITER